MIVLIHPICIQPLELSTCISTSDVTGATVVAVMSCAQSVARSALGCLVQAGVKNREST